MKSIEALLACIRVNTHSSVRIGARGQVLYCDPFQLPAAPHDADVIFLTHDHFDHFSEDDVRKAMKPETVFVLPASAAKAAEAVLAEHRTLTVLPGQTYDLDGLCFETVAAYNPAKPFHPRAKGWVGYVLSLPEGRVYIAGDTDDTEEAGAVRCDAALLPIGGKYTMDPDQAAALAVRLRPQAVLPIHYGSVVGTAEAYDRFVQALDGRVRVVRVLRP